jgi:hypothetical protein
MPVLIVVTIISRRTCAPLLTLFDQRLLATRQMYDKKNYPILVNLIELRQWTQSRGEISRKAHGALGRSVTELEQHGIQLLA